MSFAALAKPEAATWSPAKSAPRPPVRSSGLRVGEPGDVFEREADRVADRVMTGGSSRGAWSISRMGIDSPLQRKCDCGGIDECASCKEKRMLQRATDSAASPAHQARGMAPASVDRVLAGSGRPLDSAVSADMSQRFGYDFSRVRIHSDAAAGQSARDVQAKAYTVGNNVVFGAGQYSPSTGQGQRLLAHELTHVVQQERGPLGIQRWFANHLATEPASGSQAAPIPEEKRYNLQLVVPKILLTNARTYAFSNLSEPEAIDVLYQFRQKLVDIIDEHKSLHRDLRDNREEHSTVGFWADALGGVDLPDYEMWDSPRLTLTQSLYLLMNAKQGEPEASRSGAATPTASGRSQRLEQVAALLQKAADEIGRMDVVLMEYKDGTEKGAERGVTVCQVSIAVLALTTGGTMVAESLPALTEAAAGIATQLPAWGTAITTFVEGTGGAVAWGRGLALSGFLTSFLINLSNESDRAMAAGKDPASFMNSLDTLSRAFLRATGLPQISEAISDRSFDNGLDLNRSWYERLGSGLIGALNVVGNAEGLSSFVGAGGAPLPPIRPGLPPEPEPLPVADNPTPQTNTPQTNTPTADTVIEVARDLATGDQPGVATIPRAGGFANLVFRMRLLAATVRGASEHNINVSGGSPSSVIWDSQDAITGRPPSAPSASAFTPDLPSTTQTEAPISSSAEAARSDGSTPFAAATNAPAEQIAHSGSSTATISAISAADGKIPTEFPYRSLRSTPKYWQWTVALAQALRGEGLAVRLDEIVAMPRGGSSTNAAGWLRSSSFFFRELVRLHPEFFSSENLTLVGEGLAPVVDEQWIAYHPDHAWCLGETLHHHHLGGGEFAVAIPESLHNKAFWSGSWHD